MLRLFFLILLISGCTTYIPQKIRYCADYYLYTEKSKLDAVYHNYGGTKKMGGGFYAPIDNSIHVMKWRLDVLGHEVFHGMAYKGSPRLIVEDRFDHFKVQ
jgi:hypothetical protein